MLHSECSSYSQYKLPKTKIVSFCANSMFYNEKYYSVYHSHVRKTIHRVAVHESIFLGLVCGVAKSWRRWNHYSWESLGSELHQVLDLRIWDRVALTLALQIWMDNHLELSNSDQRSRENVLSRGLWELLEDDDECFSLKNA